MQSNLRWQEANEWLERALLADCWSPPVLWGAQAGADSACFPVISAISLLPFPICLSTPWFFSNQKVRKTSYLHDVSVSVSGETWAKLYHGPNVLNINETERLIFGNRTCIIGVCVYMQKREVRNEGSHVGKTTKTRLLLSIYKSTQYLSQGKQSFFLSVETFKALSYLPISLSLLLPKLNLIVVPTYRRQS